MTTPPRFCSAFTSGVCSVCLLWYWLCSFYSNFIDCKYTTQRGKPVSFFCVDLEVTWNGYCFWWIKFKFCSLDFLHISYPPLYLKEQNLPGCTRQLAEKSTAKTTLWYTFKSWLHRLTKKPERCAVFPLWWINSTEIKPLSPPFGKLNWAAGGFLFWQWHSHFQNESITFQAFWTSLRMIGLFEQLWSKFSLFSQIFISPFCAWHCLGALWQGRMRSRGSLCSFCRWVSKLCSASHPTWCL